MNSYLFLFTIGPVQSFIAQARKLQDLYAGSKLLSDLIGNAMNEMPIDTEFIFPFGNLTSKPNRFIAIVKNKNENEVKELGNKIEERIKNKFKEIADNTFRSKTSLNKPANFDEQIKNHLQVHWVSIPFDEKNYQSQFKEIESILGSVKNVRVFDQLEETGRKCSICGERNTLFTQKGNKRRLQIKPNWSLLSEYEKRTVENFNKSIIEINNPLSSNEGLCAVCFTKRFYEKSSFPSTAEIALMDTISKIDKKTIIDYKNSFTDFDYQLFYEENLNDKYFEKQNIQDVDIQSAKESLKKIHKNIKDNTLKISKYYTVIMFDGDSMGRWLSGEYLKEGSSLFEFHKLLTEKLGEFAEAAKAIVTEPKGRIVYAGGEDFLGFINLNYLFEVLKKLLESFEQIVNQSLNSFKQEGKNLTFSAGIVIAHYKGPLSEVLKWARQTEKDAKYNDDKNAFDIAILKHSGEITKTQFKWGDDDLTENIDILQSIIKRLQRDEYSNTFIKNLEREFSKLLNPKGETGNKNLVNMELKRLLKNSCQIKDKVIREKNIINFTDELIKLNRNSNAANFISALNAAEFISRHLNKETGNDN